MIKFLKLYAWVIIDVVLAVFFTLFNLLNHSYWTAFFVGLIWLGNIWWALETVEVNKRIEQYKLIIESNGCRHKWLFKEWHAGTEIHKCEKCKTVMEVHDSLWDKMQ